MKKLNNITFGTGFWSVIKGIFEGIQEHDMFLMYLVRSLMTTPANFSWAQVPHSIGPVSLIVKGGHDFVHTERIIAFAEFDLLRAIRCIEQDERILGRIDRGFYPVDKHLQTVVVR